MRDIVYYKPSKPFPHKSHFFLTVISFGAWLPIWILHRLFSTR